MNIYIRQLSEQDASAYRVLRHESLQEAPLAFSKSYEEEAGLTAEDYAARLKPVGAPPESFVLGAFTAVHSMIGTVTFIRDIRIKARHKSMIYAMYTRSDARGFGVGKALIDEVIKRAKAMEGLEQVHLWVLLSTTSAAAFYRKCGFESQGALVKNDLKINGQYVDAAYMVRYLAD
jgi:GNAT superfamily N-acetyltransferase